MKYAGAVAQCRHEKLELMILHCCLKSSSFTGQRSGKNLAPSYPYLQGRAMRAIILSRATLGASSQACLQMRQLEVEEEQSEQ